jgi:mandelamide amidase
MNALLALHAFEAAQRIAQGTVRCADYAEALITRVSEIAHLGGLLHHDAAALRRAAATIDDMPPPAPGTLPLFGVPLVFKDNIDVAGVPTTVGTPWMADHVPRIHAGVTQRLLDAGALVLGKSNLHEWSQGVTGNNHAFGPARNPYDPTRIAGGSSAGNAVVLATQAAPAAVGTDTGGSVRVPAALCGLVGFRPTVGRWPGEGVVPISPTFDTAGAMARCVADCWLLDGVVTGGPVRGPAASLHGLRIGLPQVYFWESLDPAVAAVCRAGLERLRDAGVVLVPCDPGGVGRLFAQGSMSISLFEILPALAAYFGRHGRPFDARALTAAVVSPDVRPLFERLFDARRVTPEAYAHAMGTLRPRMQAAYRECFAEHDIEALIFPTAPLPASRIGEDDTVLLRGEPVSTFHTYIRNSGPAGMAGLPGISLPAGLCADGLPVGLELDGPAGTDRRLLAIGRAIEAVLPVAAPAPMARWAQESVKGDAT